MNKNILITGATGFLCSQLARKFLNKGSRVWGLTRNRERAEELFGNEPLWTPVYQDVCETLDIDVDFDFIEEGAEKGAPKYMEWYSAFGLLVTLIWLYLEILKLLAKTRNR